MMTRFKQLQGRFRKNWPRLACNLARGLQNVCDAHLYIMRRNVKQEIWRFRIANIIISIE